MKTFVMLALATFGLSSCGVIDGLHQFESGKSEPAYPPEIADQPIIWIEGGHASLIDKNGVHALD